MNDKHKLQLRSALTKEEDTRFLYHGTSFTIHGLHKVREQLDWIERKHGRDLGYQKALQFSFNDLTYEETQTYRRCRQRFEKPDRAFKIWVKIIRLTPKIKE